ncbi:Uncharacterised protein [Halioglobus japonicus]|nr:Uncharacterised protein [Halioglobus japonicus]
MEVIRTIKPGMPGSRQFQKHWGDNLVAVRYRRNRSKLYTTIEIVVDEREQSHPDISLNAVHSFRRRQLVALPIAFEGVYNWVVEGLAEKCTDVEIFED